MASQVTLVVKKPPANAGDIRDSGSIPGLGRSPGEGNGNPLQYSCLENLYGQRSPVGYSPRGRKESDMTEQLSTMNLRHLRVTQKNSANDSKNPYPSNKATSGKKGVHFK